MHGVWGGKMVNYASGLNDVDLRFLDGEFLENSLTKLFPEKKSIYYVSGYSKLDSYFEFTEEDRVKFLQHCNFRYKQENDIVCANFLSIIYSENE